MKRHLRLKTVLIVELILCYLALLTLVSYIRAPQEYRAETESPILLTRDFVSFSGEVAGDELIVQNDASGAAMGYQSELQLSEIDRLSVSLKINCPEEYAGRTLYVDLYEFESGYDSPEQEAVLITEVGEQEMELTLPTGEQHPENACLRIFTLEDANYSIENVMVCKEIPQPKVSGAMIAVVALIVFTTVGTLVCYIWQLKKEGEREDEA